MILLVSVWNGIWSGRPRASGDDPTRFGKFILKNDVDPARAGMILLMGATSMADFSRPRASGDDPITAVPKGTINL